MIFGKSKKPEDIVGASAKIAAAERMKAAGRIAAHADAHGQAFSQTFPALGVFLAAVVLVFVAGDSFKFPGLHLTGMHALDSILAGNSSASITGMRDIDSILLVLIRAFGLFLAAGMVPLFGLGITRIASKGAISPLVGCWAAIILLPLLYIVGKGMMP